MKYIESTLNPIVKEWAKQKDKRNNYRNKTFLIENEHIIQMAIKAGLLIQLMVTDASLFNELNDNQKLLVEQKVIDKLKQTKTNTKAIGLVRFPQTFSQTDWAWSNHNQILLLDNINDPGNLGTLIRTATAFGFEAIVLTNNCVDLFNAKTIRATQGALFSIPIYKLDNLDLTLIKDHKFFLFVLNQKSEALTTIKSLPKKYTLVLGNEAKGIDSKKYLQLDQKMIHIKMNSSKIESLNVANAAAIAMFYFSNLIN